MSGLERRIAGGLKSLSWVTRWSRRILEVAIGVE